MLEPSPRLRKEAARIGCDPNHIIMADLILTGYTEVEAYDIAYSETLAQTAKQRIANRERELSSEGYKRAYETARDKRKYISDTIEDRDKDAVLKELNQMASVERDVKMKADLLMKIAEIKQMKKDLTTETEDTVNFYLPLSCEKCPLLSAYNAYVKQRNLALPDDEKDTPIRPDEMQRIMESEYDSLSSKR